MKTLLKRGEQREEVLTRPKNLGNWMLFALTRNRSNTEEENIDKGPFRCYVMQ